MITILNIIVKFVKFGSACCASQHNRPNVPSLRTQNRGEHMTAKTNHQPAMNVSETPAELIITMNVEEATNVEVSFSARRITLRGENTETVFERTVPMINELDTDDVSTEITNTGVEIRIPRA